MTLERVNELIEKKSFMELRSELLEMYAADIAAILEELSNAETIRIFRLLPKDLAAEVFSFLPIEVEQFVITSLTAKEAGFLIDNMFADDAADLIDEIPRELETEKASIDEILVYIAKEDSHEQRSENDKV